MLYKCETPVPISLKAVDFFFDLFHQVSPLILIQSNKPNTSSVSHPISPLLAIFTRRRKRKGRKRKETTTPKR
jgi:hypothetical protein